MYARDSAIPPMAKVFSPDLKTGLYTTLPFIRAIEKRVAVNIIE
jgi:hypothetical protein